MVLQFGNLEAEVIELFKDVPPSWLIEIRDF